jgi:hypothetical protein
LGTDIVISMRVTSCASAVAFSVLATVLAIVGAIPWPDAMWASAAVGMAFVPTGLWASAGFGRRMAELSLVPVAFAMTMVASAAMRRMVLPPLLLLAVWAAAVAAWDRVAEKHRPVLAALMGLSARAAVGLGLDGYGALTIALSFAVAAVLPWIAMRRWGPRAAEIAVLIGAVPAWQTRPLTAVLMMVASLALGFSSGRRTRLAEVLGWMPGFGSAALLFSSLAAWPGLSAARIFPDHGWPAWVAIVAALAVTPRLRPGAAGAVWLAVTLSLGAVQPPSPEQRAFVLTKELGELTMSAGTGGDYVVDLDVGAGAELAAGTQIAILRFAGAEHVLRFDDPNSTTVLRPHGLGASAFWRGAVRTRFAVPRGERPVLLRHPDLEDDVEVRVETIGAVRPTPPRSWFLPKWLLAAALAVALIEIGAGTWRTGGGALPWLLLSVGSLVARVPVEPLRLLGERLAADIALAALLAAWLPAARVWLGKRRVFVTVAALVLPLALATPQLTPSLYGDEPFHLVVMESLASDRDLEIADNLDLDLHPQNELYAPGRPLFHSPVLGFILLPGYWIAGRLGALALLAMMGAALATLLAGRARDFGLREPLVGSMVLVLAATYPLATFSTQIWPELPGALAIAILLVLAARNRGGRLSSLVVAVTAAAVKTRLGLLTLPVAAATWLRRRPLRGVIALLLAAGAALAVGWLTMGHPFGPYRRLHHLLPTDGVMALRVLAGLAFDAAGGLAFTAPLILVSLAGVGLLWRRGGAGERALLVGCALTLAALLHSPEWYGGGSPPARYLVPMLPAFFLAGALFVSRPLNRRCLLPVLVPPSVAAWWVLVTRPHLSVNPGDGGFWLADALSRRFAADGRSLFPSFLVVDTSTLAVPAVLVVLAGLGLWAASRWRVTALMIARTWVAVWLAAAAALVLTLDLRPDRVVEAEAPQVRKSGGTPVPPAGTFSRFSHRRGWRLDDGDAVTIPIRLDDSAGAVLEGWFLGTARRVASLELRWDDDEPTTFRWSGEGATERLRIPVPSGKGLHRLRIAHRSGPHGALVLDRVVVEEAR